MKKLLALCLLLSCLLCTSFALANGEICGLMEIVNCKEWVSLRQQPDTSAERLAQVPLGAVVRNCIKISDDFWYAEFNDQQGYILAKYLRAIINDPLQEEQAGIVPYRDLLANGDVVFRYEGDANINIIATKDFSEGECLRIGGYRKDNSPVWGWTTQVRDVAELPTTDVFMGGDAAHPLVMVHNSCIGLTALNLSDGSRAWTLPVTETNLGAGICHAAAPDGTMYIAGYYGPDPVCIGMNGQVRWQTSSGSDDVYWPYRIEVKDGCIVTCYDSCNNPETAHYEVTYGLDGAMLNTVICDDQHANTATTASADTLHP